MRLEVDEIIEIKVVSTDVDKEFMYFDRLEDGSWRLVYSKNMADRFVLHERIPEVEYIDTKGMSFEEIEECMKDMIERYRKRVTS